MINKNKVIKINNGKLELSLFSENKNEGIVTINPFGSPDTKLNFKVSNADVSEIARAFNQFADEYFKEEKKLEDLLVDEEVLENPEKTKEVLSEVIKEICPSPTDRKPKAKIIVCKDGSGSMGRYEQFVAKAFTTWNEEIIAELYADKVTYNYVSFHTEAKVIPDRDVFFNQGESGGTIASSGLNKVNEIMNATDLNTDIYVLFISDGDNLMADNERVFRVLGDIQRKAKHVSYLEVNQYSRSSTLMNGLKSVNYYNFTKHVLRTNDELLTILDNMWDQID